MTIFHHNFGVSECSDEFDGLLHKTVADLKDPKGPREAYPAPHGDWHPADNRSEWPQHEGYVTE